jgi:hypothetical protein
MSDIKVNVTGGNPYTLEFVGDPRSPGHMAKLWLVRKYDKCLSISATAVAGSDKKTKYYDQTTVKETSVPQKIQVTLECGTCTCGGEFRVAVSCYYAPDDKIVGGYDPPLYNTAIASCVEIQRDLYITCAGPDCTNSAHVGGPHK